MRVKPEFLPNAAGSVNRWLCFFNYIDIDIDSESAFADAQYAAKQRQSVGKYNQFVCVFEISHKSISSSIRTQ